MVLRLMLIAFALTFGATWSQPADAKGKAYKNLKVLKDNGKTLKKGMKRMTRGLGVKCKACHIKGKWDKDDVAAKDKSRAFLRSVVGNADAGARKKALAELLAILKLDAPRDEATLWKGISMLEKK